MAGRAWQSLAEQVWPTLTCRLSQRTNDRLTDWHLNYKRWKLGQKLEMLQMGASRESSQHKLNKMTRLELAAKHERIQDSRASRTGPRNGKNYRLATKTKSRDWSWNWERVLNEIKTGRSSAKGQRQRQLVNFKFLFNCFVYLFFSGQQTSWITFPGTEREREAGLQSNCRQTESKHNLDVTSATPLKVAEFKSKKAMHQVNFATGSAPDEDEPAWLVIADLWPPKHVDSS